MFRSIGTLSRGSVAVVYGRSRDRRWLQIAYPRGPGGLGWVLASQVRLNAVPMGVLTLP
jgi:hypothetical protein